MHPVEAERVEGLVHPLRGALGLPHGLAVDAAVRVARGVEGVDGAVEAEPGGVGEPHGGGVGRAVDQDDRRPGLGGGVRGPVPVDVRGAEGRLDVRLGADGCPHRVEHVLGGEVAVAQSVVDVAADIAAYAGGVLGHGGTSCEDPFFVVRPYHQCGTSVP